MHHSGRGSAKRTSALRPALEAGVNGFAGNSPNNAHWSLKLRL
jgi:hypothetical protein